MPHEVIGDEQPASLEHIQQRHHAMFADQRRGTIDLDHRQPPSGGRDRVAVPGVGLFANPQCVQFSLESAPIDYFGRYKFVTRDVIHLALPALHKLWVFSVALSECRFFDVASARDTPISTLLLI